MRKVRVESNSPRTREPRTARVVLPPLLVLTLGAFSPDLLWPDLLWSDGPPPPRETESTPTPLDLPSGGAAESDQEDAAESIVFYGSVYEGDAFFWCLDRSGSMGWGGAWPILRDQVRGAIEELSDEAEFGVVAYGSDTQLWSPVPRAATREARASAQAWLEALEPEGGTCLLPAAETLLELARASEVDDPIGFIVSDGLPFCQGVDTSDACLQLIPAANVPPIVVHTVYLSADAPGTEFLRELATRLGGSFRLSVP